MGGPAGGRGAWGAPVGPAVMGGGCWVPAVSGVAGVSARSVPGPRSAGSVVARACWVPAVPGARAAPGPRVGPVVMAGCWPVLAGPVASGGLVGAPGGAGGKAGGGWGGAGVGGA